MEHQIHFGKKFYQDKKTGYWISCCFPRIRAHRWVWQSINGCIEKGFHIHHIDENKSNNDISNLKCIPAGEHLSLHMRMRSPESVLRSRLLFDAIRPLAKEWHASNEGIKWHIQNGLKMWEERVPFVIQCSICHKTVKTKTYHQEFCSNACKSSARRKSGKDNEERNCEYCNTKFMANKYAKKRTCNRSCAALLRHRIYSR